MTIQERAETAAYYKQKGMLNCCQAVVKVFSDSVECDEENLLKMAAGFASGMGGMEATCGSLVGACMIAGLKTGGNGTAKIARELLSTFKEKSGAVACKDLKGVETGKVLCECVDCVRNAVYSLDEVFEHTSI